MLAIQSERVHISLCVCDLERRNDRRRALSLRAVAEPLVCMLRVIHGYLRQMREKKRKFKRKRVRIKAMLIIIIWQFSIFDAQLYIVTNTDCLYRP